MKPPSWSDLDIKHLKGMVTQGRTTGEIAMLFAGKHSRSAVSGKISRLGLILAGAVKGQPSKPKPKTFKAPKPRREVRPVVVKVVAPPPPPKAKTPEPEEIGPLNTFPDARNVCLYIKADPSRPPWRCCGQPQAPNTDAPYCAHHLARVYNTPAPRRDATTPLYRPRV